MGTPAGTANTVVNVDTTNSDKVGVFTTAQSLITFPGAVAAVTTVWKVIGIAYPPFGTNNKIVPIVLSLVVGMLIYLLSVTQGITWRERLSGLGIAIINSMTIAAAVLGISTTPTST
jgi:hypothetical protein